MKDEIIYAFGGFYGGSDSEINESIERYKPNDDSWSLLTIRLNNPLWACAAVPLNDNCIVIIGGKNKNRNGDVNMLDLSQKKWTALAPMNQARVSHKAFTRE